MLVFLTAEKAFYSTTNFASAFSHRQELMLHMIMIRVKNLNFLLLSTTMVLYSFSARFCAAQGNSRSNNTCDTYGKCGAFGVCNAQDSPMCTCLQGFYPRNSEEWNAGNWTSGCVRRVPLSCNERNNSREDGFLKLQMMNISGYSEQWLASQDICEGRCLMNCSCIAYRFEVGIRCMFWSENLIDIQKLPSGSGWDVYIRLASSELGNKKDSKKMIIIVVVVAFAIISVGGYVSWKWIAKRKGQKRASELANVHARAGTSDSVDSSSHQDALSHVNLEDLPLFKFEILANGTNNFSEINKLGKGGFGPVYKGKLVNGIEIAVKRLSKTSGQGIKEFMNEVELICKLQHRNLVRLLGCCIENNEKMLVYEYMPNKSLDFFLFDPSQKILDWRKRFNIIEGICRGLLYLHRDSRLKIIHRDLKPSNILLDNDWNPKISDFGIARIYGTEEDHVSTIRVVGTYGYMAPEYALEGRFSEKSDVYSFGVIMLEIATGRRNTNFFHQEASLNLLGHVWKLWNENNVVAFIDSRISNPSYQTEVLRCMHIGLLCVQELPKDRPTISVVLSMLNSETVELPKPKQSAFAIKSSGSDIGTSSFQQSQRSSCSVNNVSLTMVDGR